MEQYCDTNGIVFTYNSKDPHFPGKATYGGYSSHIVVDERFCLHISDKLNLAAVAPLLCAGITLYSPLKHWGATKGKKVGIVGLGGLGHMHLEHIPFYLRPRRAKRKMANGSAPTKWSSQRTRMR
jgi:uncharacterized zinc-type alcohol dehydrogenase-like protein